MSDMPKFPLIVRNDEVGYISEHDDQSYGMFCPVAIVRDAKFAAMCASAPDLLEALEKARDFIGIVDAEGYASDADLLHQVEKAIAKAKGEA